MKVHLRKRQIRFKGNTKPRYSLYLDIYYRKGKRKREFLGIYLEPNEDKTNTHLTRWCGPNVPFTDMDREWFEEFIEYLHSKVSP